MSVGAWVFVLVVIASVASVVFHIRERRRAVYAAARLRRLDAFLTAWAEDGEWNPTLKARLLKIVQDCPPEIGTTSE